MASSLQTVISGIVRKRFADAEIESIAVVPGLDSDGEPILRVTVVFDTEITKLEPGKLAGLPRHVISGIMDRKDAAFPIFRFVSKSDNERLKHAAA